MKINALNFAVGAAITAAVVWLVCSLFVWMVPGGMTSLTTNMMHMDITRTGWAISPAGVIWGLVGWSLFAGVFGWLLATIYNLLTKN